MTETNPIFSWHAIFIPFLIEAEAHGVTAVYCVRIFGIRIALIASVRK